MSKIIPNTFQTPNSYVDTAMELLTPEEYKCLSFAARHILGWQDKINKRRGVISVSMFERGYTTSEGTNYGGTGLGINAVLRAVDELVRFEFLIPIGSPTSDGQEYELGQSPKWDLMLERREEWLAKNRRRTEKARAARQSKRGVLSDKALCPTKEERFVAQNDSGLSDKRNQSHVQSHVQNHIAPDGASPSTEQTLEDDSFDTQPDFYPCDAQDIVALIAVWYDWIPRRPSKRGAIIPLQEHLQNTTNREYAENLHRRGVWPGDFAQCLGEMRLKPPESGWKEMTFSYAAKIVEEWVEADRRENVYTLDCPRIVARRPDALVQLGDPASADFFERLAANPNVIVYVPPPYISPHDAEPLPEENTVPISEADLSPERWAKEGMPL